MKRIFIAALFLFISIACFAQDITDKKTVIHKPSISLPSPAVSEYFKTSTGAFLVDFEHKEVKYVLALDIIKPLGKTVFAEIRFENPEIKDSPLIVNKVIKPEDKQLLAESAPLHNLNKDVDYIVIVLIYGNEQKTKLITKHIQVIRSSLGDRFLGGVDEAIKCILAGDFDAGGEILKVVLRVDKFNFPAKSSLTILGDFNNGAISKDYVIYFFKGLSYHRGNNFNAAIEEFQKAVATNNNYSQAYMYLGVENVSLGKYKEAVSFFEKCIGITPDYAEAYWGLAEAYKNINEEQKAKECFQKAKELFQQQGNDGAYKIIDKKLNELDRKPKVEVQGQDAKNSINF